MLGYTCANLEFRKRLSLRMADANQLAPEANGQIRFKWLPAFRSGQVWAYFGPAFVASVAYIDPGNFATNIQGGTEFGYTLLWVLLWSNAMAILVQYLSAKLGIATGHTLPQNCRRAFPRAVNFGLVAGPPLGALEERQDVVPTPAAIAKLRPVIVILRLAADEGIN